MGFFNKLKIKDEDDIVSEMEYIEVDDFERDGRGHFMIRIETLTDFADTTLIQEHVRKGNIVWVKIRPLKEKDMSELKRAIDRLRKTCIAINGDIAGVDDDFIVLTPPGIVVHRRD
ncbi:MAG: cell division protein SepF [Candidatus Aenigmarchaeota archaeon]|nr:cell division protein SepF [Candidatus Aenigmarchaeota archaeon]MCK5321869.1 cell division protein SepF [Candidatus Aenigmarchaeota archaeon]MCK5468864.1 cell division protein SepF [Cyclobacteriaceae bacterium]